MVKVKQINNLIIKLDDAKIIKYKAGVIPCSYDNPRYGKYAVFTPDGRCWEDGLTLEQAEKYCRNTTDFLNK